ncbi:hypothetical protein PSTG_06680 [Puccinia striiformis f. sp. tritici PST-78]|uniref:HAT C-terminal dimerisation domain-containing protein n=1 Tax=Puccinia striiformis f. sp. tritici PST-78 TaxID=1165861 RepID=A0A0L0VLA9_9BASI|nr:hypothetical protein PSTG_06680 [Puccinia striiformis f. sp. tritici PST-78]
MAHKMANLVQKQKGNFDHHGNHHAQCFCHVLALILGAGLRALRLSCSIETPAAKPAYFPTLTTLEEEDEDKDKDKVEVEPRKADSDIQEEGSEDELVEIDPDDASIRKESPAEDESPILPPSEGGIGFTLMKVDYICRRVASSTARKNEFKIVAESLKQKVPRLIAGYGIRWNVAYDSWVRAYKARKVIVQLLDNESENFAGKSSASHFFKGYEVSKKEWENANYLTQVSEEFLVLTLCYEEDGPNASMVLYDYYRLIDNLEKRQRNPEFTVLKAMFDPMIVIAKKYLALALNCSPILLATMLHPAWRLSLIQDKFETSSDWAEEVLRSEFKIKSKVLKKMAPKATVAKSNGDSDEDEFNYYPEKSGASQEDNELKRYLDGQWPLNKKGDPLQWWKLHTTEFPRLALVARDFLGCAGSSSTVERTFSAAADVCEPGRSLAAQPLSNV